jgi:hypothetical protein
LTKHLSIASICTLINPSFQHDKISCQDRLSLLLPAFLLPHLFFSSPIPSHLVHDYSIIGTKWQTCLTTWITRANADATPVCARLWTCWHKVLRKREEDVSFSTWFVCSRKSRIQRIVIARESTCFHRSRGKIPGTTKQTRLRRSQRREKVLQASSPPDEAMQQISGGNFGSVMMFHFTHAEILGLSLNSIYLYLR